MWEYEDQAAIAATAPADTLRVTLIPPPLIGVPSRAR
jgi:hypothetical protein